MESNNPSSFRHLIPESRSNKIATCYTWILGSSPSMTVIALLLLVQSASATGVCLVCPPGHTCSGNTATLGGTAGQVLIREGASTTWKDVSTIALQGATGPQGATGVVGATGPQGGAGAVAGTTGAKALAATASAGTTTAGTAYAAWDHVHPLPTSTTTPTTLGTTVSAGSATTLSRSDHAHGYDREKLYGVLGICTNGSMGLSPNTIYPFSEWPAVSSGEYAIGTYCWCLKQDLSSGKVSKPVYIGEFARWASFCHAGCTAECANTSDWRAVSTWPGLTQSTFGAWGS